MPEEASYRYILLPSGLSVETLEMAWYISRGFSEASSLNVGRKFDLILEKAKHNMQELDAKFLYVLRKSQ